jgi:hypothetical protein
MTLPLVLACILAGGLLLTTVAAMWLAYNACRERDHVTRERDTLKKAYENRSRKEPK